MQVRLIDMPTTVKGFVVRKDGVDTIVINARLSQDQQRECYCHERLHLIRGDLDLSGDADEVEREAHKSPRGKKSRIPGGTV